MRVSQTLKGPWSLKDRIEILQLQAARENPMIESGDNLIQSIRDMEQPTKLDRNRVEVTKISITQRYIIFCNQNHC